MTSEPAVALQPTAITAAAATDVMLSNA